jgi:putative transposase
LRDQGVAVSHKRVARLMRDVGLNAQMPRIRVVTTDSVHGSPIPENVIDRDFKSTAPNQKWVTDITYIHTDEGGWVSLSAILDLYSQKVVGWSMDQTLETSLVTRSFDMAPANRHPADGLIPHSDRGSQYASSDYRQRLVQTDITISMSRRGNCHDNACAESFWVRLKVELVHRQRFATRAEARRAIFQYIEVFHNRTASISRSASSRPRPMRRPTMPDSRRPEPCAGWHHAPPRGRAAERPQHDAQPGGWASWTAEQSGLRIALGPSTIWVPPSGRLTVHHRQSIHDGQGILAVA